MRVEVDGLVGKVRRWHSRRGNVIPPPPEWRGGPGGAGSTPGPGQEEVLGEMPVSALELLREKTKQKTELLQKARKAIRFYEGAWRNKFISVRSYYLDRLSWCFPSKLVVRQEQPIR